MTPLPAAVTDEPAVNPALIQRMYAQNCSQDEFVVFLTLARKYGLDPPSLKQIWAIKYPPGGGPATIIVSRDGLLEIAHRDGAFDGLESGTDGSIKEGNLTGWCKVYRKDMSHPFTVTVHYDEYVQKKAGGEITKFWKEKPRTMLAKVAEAQTLRKAFRVQGLYSEDEMPSEPKEIPDTSVPVDISMNKCVSCGGMTNSEHIDGILEHTNGVPMCGPCFSDWFRKECAAKLETVSPAPVEVVEEPAQEPEPEPVTLVMCSSCGKGVEPGYVEFSEEKAGICLCQTCFEAWSQAQQTPKKPAPPKPVAPKPAPKQPKNTCGSCGKEIPPLGLLTVWTVSRLLMANLQSVHQRQNQSPSCRNLHL